LKPSTKVVADCLAVHVSNCLIEDSNFETCKLISTISSHLLAICIAVLFNLCICNWTKSNSSFVEITAPFNTLLDTSSERFADHTSITPVLEFFQIFFKASFSANTLA
jgi:hypothetical protein